jgi:hypothetical protein
MSFASPVYLFSGQVVPVAGVVWATEQAQELQVASLQSRDGTLVPGGTKHTSKHW